MINASQNIDAYASDVPNLIHDIMLTCEVDLD